VNSPARRLRARWPELALVVVLASALVMQGWIVLDREVVPGLARFTRLRELPAWQRSAVGLNGEEFAAYLGFLRRTIPEDSKVIIPPRIPVSALSHVGLMQYYLFPRQIHNCGVNEVDACIERATGTSTYLLQVKEFPPADLASRNREFVRFNEDRGVYLPAR
jgi:hypothetical protein